MFYYVYVLQSIKYPDKLYIGSTSDLKKRVAKHNRAVNFSTKPYVPWRLIFYEAYLYIQDAIRREGYLKTNKGSKVIKQMLKEYLRSRKIKSNF